MPKTVSATTQAYLDSLRKAAEHHEAQAISPFVTEQERLINIHCASVNRELLHALECDIYGEPVFEEPVDGESNHDQ